ncbi:MAG: ABC transporter ATP-binding protein/permease [Actinomycetota bacterium]|nr:ABC transporter ATP-binding protein/permease [Actinomycetota bacterium]
MQSLIDRVGSGAALTAPVVLLVGVALADGVFGAFQSYLLQRTAEGVVLRARRTLIGHLLRLPIVEYDRRRIGDLISRVGADTTLLRSVVTSGLFDIVSSVLVSLGAVVLMAIVDVYLLLITLAAVAIGGAAIGMVGRAMRTASLRAQESVGDMTAATERALSSIRTLRASGATVRETKRVGESAQQAYDAGVRMARLQSLVSPIVNLSMQGSFIGVLAFGGYRVAIGAMTLGEFIAFLLYLFALVFPLAQAFQAFTAIQTGMAAFDRMTEVLHLPAEDANEHNLRRTPNNVRAQPNSAAPALDFDGVCFGYETGPPVLDAVSFTVERGARTALVGPSGSGKTTALALIERFYNPTGGVLRVDGVDIREIPREHLRERIGYVEQEAPVLAGTISDNLRLGAPEATDEQLLRSLDLVGLSAIVARSPLGLEAPVGDDGVLLSGGQRQRLAWARMMLTDPELILLDEPTSSVDSGTEQVLRGTLDRIATDRTVLVVAHRLSTVADSDRIIVLDAGRVGAVGTHQELLEGNSLYRELASHQLLA